MKPPCIIVVNYLLPALRGLIARELIEKYGLSRVEAAEKMGLTPAAITQYIKKVRGEAAIETIESSDDAIRMISEIAKDLAEDKASLYEVLKKICKTCQIIRSKGLLCEIHREMLPALKEDEKCEREFRLPLKHYLERTL